jgi:flagellar biosynthesis/type III secretory pathway chaperone
MKTDWNEIADCLRSEIIEYGALLSGFEAQQKAIFSRDSEEVLRISGEIEKQVAVVHTARESRERKVAAFALENGRPQNATLRSLVTVFEADAQPLIEALITDVNLLVHRIRRANRHNHTLLARTVAAHREALRVLRPGSFNGTYSAAGRVPGISPAVALQAAG